jgi:hypothetical protein
MACEDLRWPIDSAVAACYQSESMVQFSLAILFALRVFFRTPRDTALEILALRQQVAVLKRKRPRPPLNAGDRLFWTTLRRIWPRWPDVLLIIKPEPLSDSTVPAFPSTGAGDPDRGAGDPASARSSGI